MDGVISHLRGDAQRTQVVCSDTTAMHLYSWGESDPLLYKYASSVISCSIHKFLAKLILTIIFYCLFIALFGETEQYQFEEIRWIKNGILNIEQSNKG